MTVFQTERKSRNETNENGKYDTDPAKIVKFQSHDFANQIPEQSKSKNRLHSARVDNR